jgi:hypothetical protein
MMGPLAFECVLDPALGFRHSDSVPGMEAGPGKEITSTYLTDRSFHSSCAVVHSQIAYVNAATTPSFVTDSSA